MITELLKFALGEESDAQICQVVIEDHVKKVIQEDSKVEILWLGRGLDDAIYSFWQMQKAGVLADTCYIIFSGIKSDLVRIVF